MNILEKLVYAVLFSCFLIIVIPTLIIVVIAGLAISILSAFCAWLTGKQLVDWW